MRSVRSLIAACAVLTLGACAGGPEAGQATGPAAGDGPQRLVTLNGTLTEIVAALGFEDRIVGVDVTSTFPASVKALPKAGHDRNIRAEGVLSLRPGHVFGTTWQLDPSVARQLSDAHVRVSLFRQELSVEGTERLIRQVADTLGVPDRAGALVAAIHQDAAKVTPLATPPKVLFIYARSTGSPMVAGDGTPMDRIIRLAGGTNAVGGFTEFKPLTPEALVAADPDAILLFASGMDALQGTEGLLRLPGMDRTKAGRNKAFIAMDGGLLAGFGPRLGRAMAELNAALRALPPSS